MADASRLTLDGGAELARLNLHPRKVPVEVDIPPEGVGRDLCRARQRSGKQLSDVWLVLKIKPDHLIAIEEGRFEALPGRVYAIGFVRSYAAFLGLDAKTFVERLKAEIGARMPADDPMITAEDAAINVLPMVWRKVPQSAVVGGLLFVALIYSGYHVLASAGRAVEPPVMPVPARLAAEAGLTQPAVPAPTSTVVQQDLPFVAPEPPPAPALPPVPSEVTVTPSAVALPVELMPRIRPQLPAGRRYGTQNRNSRITLRAHRPTHVAVQGNRNRTFIDRSLAPGDTYRVPNMVGLRLSAPDAGAVEIILDGTSIGFVGADGAVARELSLNPQNIVDRRRRG
jgi:cytoskeleton protein RodZ